MKKIRGIVVGGKKGENKLRKINQKIEKLREKTNSQRGEKLEKKLNSILSIERDRKYREKKLKWKRISKEIKDSDGSEATICNTMIALTPEREVNQISFTWK